MLRNASTTDERGQPDRSRALRTRLRDERPALERAAQAPHPRPASLCHSRRSPLPGRREGPQMSAEEKRRVKAAVERFVGDQRNTRVNPGDLAALVEAEIGIAFGATTIARYLAAHGWARDGDGSPVVYSRPPKAKKTR